MKATLIGIDPKPNDFEFWTRLLLPGFKWAGDKFPENKKLDLILGVELPMVKNFITFKVKAEKVIHVYMKT